jgi:glucose-1-phosphate adenylyltransferase
MNDVLVLILGGGRGTRLAPLTTSRSKPAVPIGGKYRLIDVPVSNCLHAGLRRIFVLTQFNSASLNRHIAGTYRLDRFSSGFVDIIAAEQTPDNANWFQGTADAVRQAMRHFLAYDADYYLVLAGDHLYRMDLLSLIETHIDRDADITIAAQPVSPADATSMGIFCFDVRGQISSFEEKPSADRLAAIGMSIPASSALAAWASEALPYVASMGIYVFSRHVLIEVLERHGGVDFGKEIIPAALAHRRVHPFLYRGYWADVGTIGTFHEANIRLTDPHAQFAFGDAERPTFTFPYSLAPSAVRDSHLDRAIVAEGCLLDKCRVESSVVGIRTRIEQDAAITNSVLLGADVYHAVSLDGREVPPIGIGRGAVLDRVIVDKNARIGEGARLVNAKRLQHADGDGWCIREGIIVVPKDAIVGPGTEV